DRWRRPRPGTPSPRAARSTTPATPPASPRACPGSPSTALPATSTPPTHPDDVVEVGEPGDEVLVDVVELEPQHAPIELLLQPEVAHVVQLVEEGPDRLALPQL